MRALATIGVLVDDVDVQPPVARRRVLRTSPATATEDVTDDADDRRGADPTWGPPWHRRSSPPERGGACGTLRDIAVLTGRNLVHIAREPMQLSDVTVQPVLFTLLFAYVFGAAIVTPGRRHLHGLRDRRPARDQPGDVDDGHRGRSATDLTSGVIDRFRTLPMRRPSVLAGRTIADLLHRRPVRPWSSP